MTQVVMSSELLLENPHVWNARLVIEDQTWGERFEFFSGTTIFPTEVDHVDDPPLGEAQLTPATGRSYFVVSCLKTIAREPSIDQHWVAERDFCGPR